MQRLRVPLLLVSLLCSVAAFAQQQSPNVWVVPPSPTDEDQITIGVSTDRPYAGAAATVNGNTIIVNAPSVMCDPPFRFPAYATVGPLAPGEYTIEARGTGGEPCLPCLIP